MEAEGSVWTHYMTGVNDVILWYDYQAPNKAPLHPVDKSFNGTEFGFWLWMKSRDNWRRWRLAIVKIVVDNVKGI